MRAILKPGALVVLLGVALLCTAPAAAQKKRPPKGAAADAAAAKTEAAAAAQRAAAAEAAAQRLQVQMAALKLEIQGLRAAQGKQGKLKLRLKSLERRLGSNELKLAALRLGLAEGSQNAGFKDGFFLQSGSRRFLLRIHGFLQGGYTGRIYSQTVTYGGVTVGEDESSFDLRRLRLEFSGHVASKILRYHLELAYGIEEPGPVLAAYGEMNFFPLLNLRFGQQKISMSRQFLIHSAFQHFIDRSNVVRAFAPGWDLGLKIHGDVPIMGNIRYELGLFNGAGSAALHDDNTDFLYNARLLFEPFGKVPYAEGDSFTQEYRIAAGASFTYNLARTDRAERLGITDSKQAAARRDADGDGTLDNVGIYQVAGELTARLRMVLWQSEVFYRIEDPGAVGPSRSYMGFYSQVGLVPHFSHYEVAARYGYWEPHYYGALRDTPRPQRVHEVSAVVNFFIWKRRVKWQLDYTFQLQQELTTADKTDLGSLNVHQIRVGTQLYF